MRFRNCVAQRIYDFLDVGKAPIMADCIFVLAGLQVRKAFGIKMWRIGYAAHLILSVDRFDWRKFRELDLESDGGLESMVDQTPKKKRHFFVRLNHQGGFCSSVRKGFFGTHSEARELERYLRGLSVRSLLVVSSPSHMRRASLAFRRAFSRSSVLLTFVASPEKSPADTPEARAAVWAEFRKYLLYKLLFL